MQAVSAKPMSPSGQQGQPSQSMQDLQSPRSTIPEPHQGRKTSKAINSENHSNLTVNGPKEQSLFGLVCRVCIFETENTAV